MNSKKAVKIKYNKIIYVFLFFVCFFLFSGCGLDYYYYLSPPLSTGHEASYQSSDKIENYFTCLTNEESGTGYNSSYFSDDSAFIFLGTEILYKIYNNYSTMTSNINKITSLNNSSSTSSTAASSLIETYTYQPLTLSYGSQTPLIKAGSSPKNRYFYLRLNSYGSTEEYQPGICISTSSMSEWSSDNALKINNIIVYPKRTTGNGTYGFDFNSSDTLNPLPESGDSDVNYSSSSSESGVWYVDVWAVSVGRDTTYTEQYSSVLHLGTISIYEDDYE